MADEKKTATKEKAPATTEASTDAVKDEAPDDDAPQGPLVERDRLISNAYDIFGRDPHVVAGALSRLDGRKTEFTREEVEIAITDFLKAEVPAVGAEDEEKE